jgi:tetratricopeptide (TPR) repeat protein
MRHDEFVIDPRPMWDFDDPAASEARFREAAAEATGTDRGVMLTQVARALGLQERFAEAHHVLDGLAAEHPELVVRIGLERGRLLRSAGQPEAARPLFEAGARFAASVGLEELQVDALHMAALVAPADQQVSAHEAALEAARAATDPRARDWDASILNNLGMVHADAGDHGAALPCFEAALAASERIGDVGRTRVARWMVGWSLRHLGRRAEALAVQRALKAELVADDEADPFVDEELGLLGD